MPYTFIEGAAGFNSQLFRYARTLVRGAAERAKPNEQRLREYVDTALPLLEQQLARAGAGVSGAREADVLVRPRAHARVPRARITRWCATLLAEYSPDTLAAALVDGSKLADPAVRKQLWDGGQAAIDASQRPDDPHREARRRRRARGCASSTRTRSRRSSTRRQEKIAARALRRARHQRLSGCHVHAAPELRHGAGLERRTARRSRRSRGSRGPSSAPPAAIRSACRTAGRSEARPARHADAVQSLDQQRHRRRQFRQPADQREGRDRRPDLRRQHPLDLRLATGSTR